MLRIPLGDLTMFEMYAKLQGFSVRQHSSLTQKGIQVYHNGHWMAVVWNRNNKCWTVDNRLAELLSKFENRNKV